MNKSEATGLLGRTSRTVNRYIRRYLEEGIEGLRDRRKSNYRKLTEKEEKQVVQCKLEGKHRSARFIRIGLDFWFTSRRSGGFWSGII